MTTSPRLIRRHRRAMWTIAAAGAGLALSSAAGPAFAAGFVYREVKDLNPTGTGEQIANLAAFDGKLFFAGSDGLTGSELWVSDGTTAGTQLLVDFNPAGSGSPRSFTAMNGELYFVAQTAAEGAELWKTNGTAAGTTLVADIRPGASGSFPSYLTTLGNTLVFTAGDAVNGTELWLSDGTPAGTTLLKDIRPGATGSNASDLVTAGGKVYFRADNGSNGAELWATDGTPGGTAMVKDIRPGATASFPTYLIEHEGKAFFRADDGSVGVEPWISDGSAIGTTLVSDVRPAGSSAPTDPLSHGSKVFFAATSSTLGQEPFVYDSNTGITTLLKDINPNAGYSSPSSFRSANGTVYFKASDGTHGIELWKTDGTPEGTVMVKDIQPGPGSGNPGPYGVQSFAEFAGQFFFTADDGVNGLELWRTDGTDAGTLRVTRILPGAMYTEMTGLTVVGNSLYFTTRNSITGATGSSLWAVDDPVTCLQGHYDVQTRMYFVGDWCWNGQIVKDGPGTLTPELTGDVTFSPDAQLDITAGVVVLEGGDLTADVTNDALLDVVSGVNAVKQLDGAGDTTIAPGATLKARRLRQSTLTIGGSAPPMSLPEPASGLMLALGAAAVLRRRRGDH